MLIGMMSRSKRPPLIAKATSLIATNYGIRLIYFTPWDVDLKQKKIKGKVYEKHKWRNVTENIPPLIDIQSRCFRRDTRPIVDGLRKYSVFTFDRANTPSKLKLQNALLEDQEFEKFVIPTKRLEDINSLYSFIDRHEEIIIKPLYGQQGQNVYRLIKRQNNSYELAFDACTNRLTKIELEKFYLNNLKSKRFIMQKFIDSRTINNDPFDCRVMVQKNRQGKWEIAMIFMRTGIGQKVVSNTAKGGGISYPKQFLKINFGDKWKDIYKNIKKLSLKLAYKMESIKQTPTMDLGLDIGIDKDGQLYIFEVNNGAGIKRLVAESAILRTEYYLYLFETEPFLNASIKENETLIKSSNIKYLQKKNHQLLQKVQKYNKKLKQIRDSTSWRITKPIRYIGKLFK